MNDKRQRRLPTHVDGRIKIGIFPLKQFVMFLPLALIIIIITLSFLNPLILMLGIISLGLAAMLFSELSNKESGFNMLRATIKYWIEGNKLYERSCLDVPIQERFIDNKKVEEIRARKNTNTN